MNTTIGTRAIAKTIATLPCALESILLAVDVSRMVLLDVTNPRYHSEIKKADQSQQQRVMRGQNWDIG
jgi:hypothetical protein